MVGHIGARNDPCCCRVEFAPARSFQEVARKDNVLALAPSEALADQVLGSCIHRFAHFTAEATRAQGRLLAREELAIEPSGASSLDLRLQRQVGTDGNGDALSTGRVLEVASSITPPSAASLAASRSDRRTWWARPCHIGLYAVRPVDKLMVTSLVVAMPPEPLATLLADGGYAGA